MIVEKIWKKDFARFLFGFTYPYEEYVIQIAEDRPNLGRFYQVLAVFAKRQDLENFLRMIKKIIDFSTERGGEDFAKILDLEKFLLYSLLVKEYQKL
jgi:hypothetical protein